MALIKNIADLKEHFPISADFNLNGIDPYIARVESEIIIPNIGQDQYDDLNTAYNSGTPTANQQKLIDKIQPVIAQFAFLYYIPVGQLTIDNAGIRIASDEKMKAAFERQIDDLKDSTMRNGYAALEDLLKFLEANKATYTIWAGSSAYTVFKEFFITSATEFSKYYNIQNSRLTFNSLKAAMRKVEEFNVHACLDDDTYDTLKAQVLSGSVSSDNEKLLNFIKPAVAYLTIANGLTDMNVKVGDSGVVTFRNISTTTNKAYEATSDKIQDAIIKKATEDGNAYLKRLRDFLNKNASDSNYTTYFESDLYIDLEESDEQIENDPDAGIIGV